MSTLLHQFVRGIWAMRPEAADAYMGQVRDIMMGRIQPKSARNDAQMKEETGLCFFTQDGRRLEVGREPIAPEPGLVAVVNITGPIMKDDYCDSPGMSTMARWMQEFENTPEVEGVVINADSPGGNGYGMLALTEQLERMQKPVVTLVSHGMACSAMYGIASATDMVFTNSEVDEVGSIGTYVRLVDPRGAWEKEGFKLHTIKATRSTDKNALVEEAFKADPADQDDEHYKAIRAQYIDPFNEHFIALVKRNRPGVAESALTGRVFMSNEAMQQGLIDATGKTLSDAVAAVRELATKRKTANN
jgi:protease-4